MNEKEAKFRAFITYIANGFVGFVPDAKKYARKNNFPESEIDKTKEIGTKKLTEQQIIATL